MIARHDTYEMMHDELKNILLGDPDIAEASAKEELWNKLKTNEDVFRLLFDNWFNVNWHRYEPKVEEVITKVHGKKIKGRNVIVVRKTYRPNIEADKKLKVVAKRIIKEKASIILMNLPMPNGKTLRDCTGSECIKIGGWIGLVGKAIKPAEKVGKQLSETDLRNLYMRNAA